MKKKQMKLGKLIRAVRKLDGDAADWLRYKARNSYAMMGFESYKAFGDAKPSRALMHYIHWAHTPQGKEFWSEMHERLQQVEEKLS